MKKENVLSKDFQKTLKCDSFLSTPEAGFVSKTSKHIRKIIFIGSLAGIGLFLNSCMAGYVATEPTYSEYSRPQRPSDLHVWIDGDWVYNRSTRVYVQRSGYWQQPQQGRVYVSGHWKSTPRGKYWSRGHWKKQNYNSKHDKRRR
ncbi:MAG: hypothetical protein WC384_17320 [Prolixibacteraceae bacterium]